MSLQCLWVYVQGKWHCTPFHANWGCSNITAHNFHVKPQNDSWLNQMIHNWDHMNVFMGKKWNNCTNVVWMSDFPISIFELFSLDASAVGPQNGRKLFGRPFSLIFFIFSFIFSFQFHSETKVFYFLSWNSIIEFSLINRIMYLFHLLSSDNEVSLTLIWVGFLGVCFEVRGVGGRKLPPSKTC